MMPARARGALGHLAAGWALPLSCTPARAAEQLNAQQRTSGPPHHSSVAPQEREEGHLSCCAASTATASCFLLPSALAQMLPIIGHPGAPQSGFSALQGMYQGTFVFRQKNRSACTQCSVQAQGGLEASHCKDCRCAPVESVYPATPQRGVLKHHEVPSELDPETRPSCRYEVLGATWKGEERAKGPLLPVAAGGACSN
jgi:hypothetical protein